MSTRATLSLHLIALASLLLASGCEKFQHYPYELDRTRVLAVRVEPASDPAQSIPTPGEAAHVFALVVDPGADLSAERAWAFSACPESVGLTNPRACIEAAFAHIEGTGPVDFQLTTPSGAASRSLLTGIVCTGAPVVMEGGEYGCAGGQGERVVFVISTSTEIQNRHPELAGALQFAGQDWPQGQGCEDSALPRITAGASEVPIVWPLGEAARESTPEGLEELLVSHAATLGELERYYSSIRADEATSLVEVGYTPPSRELVTEGEVEVEFVFVVRDSRGGVAWLRRSLCVQAP